MAREDLTRALAEFTLGLPCLPPRSLKQAQRAFTNHLGCALGASAEAASLRLRGLADAMSGPRTATVLGDRLRLDPLHAAWTNALQSSIQTFDDTHLASVIHPTGPVAAALAALVEHERGLEVTGRAFLDALGIGIEVSCRVALALTAPPAQPHLGLFMTGITGGIGAAAACARLLGLDLERTRWAMGTAAAQAGGLRATHTTMAAGLVPAVAARAGLESAWLAQRGFEGPASVLEHRNGLLPVLAPGALTDAALEGLGESFELDDLSFKPYPCGVVIHPVIDACLALAQACAGEVPQQVVLQVHPLALQLTGTRHPAHALACNASVFHWAAAALVRGRAGLPEATETALHAADIVTLREQIEARADDRLGRDQAHVQVLLRDGRRHEVHIDHARGSRECPLTHAELQCKVSAMAAPVLGAARTAELLSLCEALPRASAGWHGPLLAAAVPDHPV